VIFVGQYRIAVIGLGLMGGSLAYALRGFRDCRRVGADIDRRTREGALAAGAVDEAHENTADAIRDADLCIFCTFPSHIEEALVHHAEDFKKNAVVSEIAGLKSAIGRIAEQNLPSSVDYVGIHPMVGKEVGGFANADRNLFAGAGFIITPNDSTRPESVELTRDLARHIGAARTAAADAQTHDENIAWSSGLMHIASAALCMKYPAKITKAFTGGAFRDCTRIANIDPELWTELLSRNSQYILPALDAYMESLSAVRDVLAKDDREGLYTLLESAREGKREVESR